MYEIFRAVSVVEAAAVVVMAFLLVHAQDGWHASSAADRFRYSGVILLAGAWGYGAVESLLMQTPGGPRVVVGTVALGYMAVAYGMILREDHEKVSLNGVHDDEDGVM